MVSLNRTDLTGRKFNRLTVIEKCGLTPARVTIWKCRCDCGNESRVTAQSLARGTTMSCGCYKRDATIQRQTTHGESGVDRSPEYGVWAAMKARCNRPSSINYHNYGGRGIRVCQRWSDSFENFLSDMGRRPSSNYQIEREDNDGDYEPGNCKWATRRDQNRNRRGLNYIVVRGERMIVADAVKKYGVVRQTFAKRLARGLSVEAALGLSNINSNSGRAA